MKNNIRFLLGVTTGFLLGGVAFTYANQYIQAIQNTSIKISLNNELQEFTDETTGEKQYPITYNDRTYLPLRNVANLAGLNVEYDNDSNTAILSQSKISEIISKAENEIKWDIIGSDIQNVNKAVRTKVNCINVYDQDFINLICNGKKDEYTIVKDENLVDFFKYQIALNGNTTNDIPTFGTIQFTIEYEHDVNDGMWAGNGPDYVSGKFATGSREFVYKDGVLTLNTGGTFTTNWEKIEEMEENYKNAK